jgi:hypothetical protein
MSSARTLSGTLDPISTDRRARNPWTPSLLVTLLTIVVSVSGAFFTLKEITEAHDRQISELRAQEKETHDMVAEMAGDVKVLMDRTDPYLQPRTRTGAVP